MQRTLTSPESPAVFQMSSIWIFLQQEMQSLLISLPQLIVYVALVSLMHLVCFLSPICMNDVFKLWLCDFVKSGCLSFVQVSIEEAWLRFYLISSTWIASYMFTICNFLMLVVCTAIVSWWSVLYTSIACLPLFKDRSFFHDRAKSHNCTSCIFFMRTTKIFSRTDTHPLQRNMELPVQLLFTFCLV